MSSKYVKSNFKFSTLALSVSLSLMTSSVFALEAMDDQGLAASTGEGIAFLPENLRMQFNGADNKLGTGYIRTIPVGPLTSEAVASGAQKADVFLYGLAISHADTDSNKRFNDTATGFINSWGTASNPWLLKVQTNNAVPNFAGVNSSLSYVSLEAPEYNIAGFADATQHDYHLKLGLWADLFMRDPKIAAPDANPSGWGAGLSNRLRLQAIWNDFSINGSGINIFQTLGGATNTGGLSTSYNNTLGLSGTVRLNSGDTKAANTTGTIYKAAVSGGAVTRTRTNEAIYLYGATTNRVPEESGGKWAELSCGDDLQCYQYRVLRTTDNYQNATFTMPSNLSVLRFSTRGVTGENTSTPAIDGSATAPTFDANEGIFLYGANFNLVLGSLYQPLIIGTADDGKNLSMEIARIPNQANVYQKIYTAYAGQLGGDIASNYKGSTCNVYQCGTATDAATHSSITIGSTNYSGSGTNLVTAYSGSGALGVSFGSLQSTSIASLNKDYYQLQFRYRQKADNLGETFRGWQYLNADDSYDEGNKGGTGSSWNEFSLGDWFNARSVDYKKYSIDPRIAHAASYVAGRDSASNFCSGVAAQGAACTTATAQSWGGTNALPGAMVTSATWASNPAPASAFPANELSAPNNLGSAAIDGLLIQHMKLTTKGL